MALKKKTWLYIVVGVFALGALGAILDKQKPKTESAATAGSPSSTAAPQSPASPAASVEATPSAMPVAAAALYQDYQANEVAADEKYKGKYLAVTGTVDSIGKDIADTMYVTLSSGKQYSITGVQCMFADEHKKALAKLSKGQKVTIRGRCDGKFGNVLLRECALQ